VTARSGDRLGAAVSRAVAALPAAAREASEVARPALESYLALLLEANAAVNLVSARSADPDALSTAHLFDALFGLSFLPAQGAKPRLLRLLDLGSGGGFPAIPLLVVRRDIEGTLVESVRKKCDFLVRTAERLALTLHVANARFPDSFPMQSTGPFDVLTTRAVGSAGELVRAARLLLVPDARALVWTTAPLVKDAIRESRARSAAFHPVPGTERRGILVLGRFT